MIEERIPGGRFLTTTALLLAVLAVIATSCAYLYRIVALPIIGLVMTAFTTGKITSHDLLRLVVSLIIPAIMYTTLEWLHRGTSRLMREILNSHGEILVANQQVNDLATEALQHVLDLTTRVEKLENGT